jgi:PAS domain S-box-containing protein
MRDAIDAASRAAMHHRLPPELFSGFLAISADAVIAVDEEQRIIFFNAGAERIFGWTASELGGEYLAVLLPERFRSQHRGHVEGFGAAHGTPRLMGERQQISGLRKSGEEFPAEASIQRIEVDGRNVYAAVLRDISARQRVQDELHQAIRARDDMMGIVSHDLRNPANAVKMLAASILSDGEPLGVPTSVLERVRVMQQAAAQMDALIQDLLDVTRIEAGRLRVTPRRVSLVVLVDDALDAMRPLAESVGVALSARCDEAPSEVWVDPERMIQVLSNVVGNALNFTLAGGRVELRVAHDGDGVEFRLTDTGEGIDPEFLPHVFDRYFQALPGARSGRRQGAGLGLPIARGIVEAHGGRMTIESTLGEGTTVTIRLPGGSPPATPAA